MNSRIILLVEDNPSDVELTKRALLKGSVTSRLIVAEDGQEALDYLEDESSALPSLILLDLKLPKIDGLEVLRRIRGMDRTRRLPVVVLTTSKEEQDVAQCYDLGVNSYIRKPVDYIQFSEAVQHLRLYWLVVNEQPPPKDSIP